MTSASEESYVQTVMDFLDVCNTFFSQAQEQGATRDEVKEFIDSYALDDGMRLAALMYFEVMWPEGK